MYTIDRAICLAVLRVFRGMRVTRSGGSVRLDDMQTAWPSTGLRAHDLGAGIAWLQQGGFVRMAVHPPGTEKMVTLLPAGESRLRSAPGVVWGWLEDLGSALALRAYARRRGSSVMFRGFRSTDPSSPAMSGPAHAGPDMQATRLEQVRD